MNYCASPGIKQQSLEFESPRKRKRTCQTQFSDTSSPPSPESGIDLDMASPPWFATSRSNTSNAQGGYTLVIVEEPEQVRSNMTHCNYKPIDVTFASGRTIGQGMKARGLEVR